MVISITSFINLYCLPIALKNIQWKTMLSMCLIYLCVCILPILNAFVKFLVFVAWDAVEGVVWYCECPLRHLLVLSSMPHYGHSIG